jgi:DNA polymerase elongation subunit (family B)
MLALDIETVAAIEPDERICTMAAKRGQEPHAFCALFPPLARVVAIGMRNTDTGKGMALTGIGGRVAELSPELRVSHRALADEKALLAHVAEVIIKQRACLLTFNGRRYDVPVLIHRMLIAGVSVPSGLMHAATQKPWEKQYHVDMMNELSFGGAVAPYPLEAYCAAYGLPNPKADGDGGMVQDLVANGDLEHLIKYVMRDVDAVVDLWRKWTG